MVSHQATNDVTWLLWCGHSFLITNIHKVALRVAMESCRRKENDPLQENDPEMEDFQPPKKKPRFKIPVTDQQMEEINKGYVPRNTQKNTAWGLNVFLEWKAQRNKDLLVGEEGCPDDLIDNPDPAKLNHWLCKFATEVQKRDGTPYPPQSIHLILAALQRKMLETTPDALKFFGHDNLCFLDLQRTCDYTYRQLRKEGIGVDVRHASTFTPTEEHQL